MVIAQVVVLPVKELVTILGLFGPLMEYTNHVHYLRSDRMNLIKEFHVKSNNFTLQVFATRNSVGEVRYYFGFPLKLIEKFLDTLEQDIYWGEHTSEENGYYIFYTGIISRGDQPVPWQLLDMRFKRHFIPQFNAALRAAKKFVGRQYGMQVPTLPTQPVAQSMEDILREIKQG
jgi:hypothetical protein